MAQSTMLSDYVVVEGILPIEGVLEGIAPPFIATMMGLTIDLVLSEAMIIDMGMGMGL